MDKSSHTCRRDPHTTMGSCVRGKIGKIMQRDASALHKSRNVCSAIITIKMSLEALHEIASFRRALGAGAPTRGLIITIEAY